VSNKNVYGGQFCSPDERQISTIGTGYLANYVSGSGSKRAGATLTNKRVYFSGKVFTFVGRRLSLLSRRQIVNTRDITGTGYDFYRPIRYIILAIFFLIAGLIGSASTDFDDGGVFLVVGAVLFIVFLIIYFNKRLTLMFIEYAGGNIAFNVKWIQKHEQDDFMRNIHLAKDNLYSKSAEAQGFISGVADAFSQNTVGGGTPDEIPDL